MPIVIPHMEPNKIAISLEDYPDLVDKLKGAGPGDKITVSVTFAVDETDDKLIVGSITKVDGEDTKSADVEKYDDQAPVFSVMGKK